MVRWALVTYGTITSSTSDFVRSHCWTYNYNVENEDYEQNGLPRWYDEQIDPLSRTTQFFKDDLGSVVYTLYADDTHTRTIYGSFNEFDETLTKRALRAGRLPGGPLRRLDDRRVRPRDQGENAVTTVYLYDLAGNLTDVWMPRRRG